MPGNKTSSGRGKRGSSQTATEEDVITDSNSHRELNTPKKRY